MKSELLQSRMKKLFTEGFTAMDIAEPLLSFDADKPAKNVRQFMSDSNLDVVGVRKDGVVAGYVELDDLADGTCGDFEHRYDEGAVLHQKSSYRDVIDCLSRFKYCFVSVLGNVSAVITRNDIRKPSVRMWLFGMISIVEMHISRTLKAKYKDSSWQTLISAKRLEKSQILQEERKKRNQKISLLDCLQLADKAKIFVKDPDMRKDIGFGSKRETEKVIRDFEALRNSLAHAHNIVAYDWDMIVTVAERLEKILARI